MSQLHLAPDSGAVPAARANPNVLVAGLLSPVCGLFSILVPLLLLVSLGSGIYAMVLGVRELQRIQAGELPSSEGLTVYLGMAGGALGMLVSVGMLVLTLGFLFVVLVVSA